MAIDNRRYVVCDIDKTDDAVEGIRFGLDGKHYVIDLMPHYVEELREFLAKFIQHATEEPPATLVAPTGPAAPKPRRVNAKHQAIRAWAKELGRETPHHITKALIEEYEAAQNQYGSAA